MLKQKVKENINLKNLFNNNNNNNNKEKFINPYFDKNYATILKGKDIKLMREQLKEEIKKEILDRKALKNIVKIFFLLRKNKNYNEYEINELDYDDAIIYDKRNFCVIFWYLLKQKHIILNILCFGNPLKPFSIKLFIIIFTVSCYCMLNGFFYNDEYLIKKLTSEEKSSLSYIFEDSYDRIIYTSLIGGFISLFTTIVFNIEQKIENALKRKKDNIILLRGEIVEIYKCNKVLIIAFIIFQYIFLIFFNIYAFCFFYCFPNNKLDWLESSALIIVIIQMISFINIFFVSLFKYISIKYQCEILFKINAYLEDNL